MAGRQIVIEIIGDAKKYSAATNDAVKATVKMQSGMDKVKQSIVQGLGLGAGVGVFGLVTKGIGMVTDFLGDASAAASNLNETQSKLDQVFKTSAGVVRNWAENSAESMGMSKQAALEAAGTFGNFLEAMGQAEPEAAQMSTKMVQLAGDLASFNNQDPTAVLQALQSGLAGETEPLRRFGVDISDARVQSELLASGVKKVGKAFTQQQKIQARFNIIMAQTVTAQGDYARTANGTANAQRTLAAETENAKAKVGKYLNDITNFGVNLAVRVLPMVVEGLGQVGVALDNIHRFIDPVFGEFAKGRDQAASMSEQFGLTADEVNQVSENLWQAKNNTKDLQQQMGAFVTDLQGALQMSDNDAKNTLIAKLTDQLREISRYNDIPLIDVLDKARSTLHDFGIMANDTTGFMIALRSNLGLTSQAAKQAAQDTALGVKALADVLREKSKEAVVNASRDMWDPAIRIAREAGQTTAQGFVSKYAEVLVNQGNVFWQTAAHVGAAVGPKNPAGPAAQLKVTTRSMLRTMADVMGPWKAAWKEAAAWAKGAFSEKAWGAQMKQMIQKTMKDAAAAGAKGFKSEQKRLTAVADAMRFALKHHLTDPAKADILSLIAALRTFNNLNAHIGKVGTLGKNGPTAGRASGGPVQSGKTYLVGEKGPELVTMGGNAYVTPHDRLGGGGTTVINNNVTVQVHPGGDLVEAGRQVVRAIQQYERRSGKVWRTA